MTETVVDPHIPVVTLYFHDFSSSTPLSYWITSFPTLYTILETCQSSPDYFYTSVFFVYFAHTQWCSGLTPCSEFKDHFWWDSGDQSCGILRIEPGQSLSKHKSYPLYYLFISRSFPYSSAPPVENSNDMMMMIKTKCIGLQR